ncbi:MAG: DUF5519 family protein [Actinobacteria bacterium]|nr:DUF5519 family protein [Actinomycetota bacterium]
MSLTRRIVDEVSSWEGVTAVPHDRGGVQLLLGRRELGHVHPAGAADLPFTRRIRDALVETGRAAEHPFARDSGWVRKQVDSPLDAAEAIELFRLSHERALVAQSRAGTRRQA